MSNLENINYDEIENKIMMVLVQNQGKLVDYKLLFSKVIDRFNRTNTLSIHTSFKYKFLLVIKQLVSKYDDIELIKIDNISYLRFNETKISNVNEDYSNKILEPEYQTEVSEPELPHESSLASYIVDNDLFDHFYINGDTTIYHDLVSGNNYIQINKLLVENKMIIHIKDKYSQTPLDYIKNQEVSNIFIKDLYKKINNLESKNKELTLILAKINKQLDVTLFELILRKIIRIIKNNLNIFSSLFLVTILILYTKFIL